MTFIIILVCFICQITFILIFYSQAIQIVLNHQKSSRFFDVFFLNYLLNRCSRGSAVRLSVRLHRDTQFKIYSYLYKSKFHELDAMTYYNVLLQLINYKYKILYTGVILQTKLCWVRIYKDYIDIFKYRLVFSLL